jgi:hypothetical protein
MECTRIIRNPRWGNAVVGTLVGVYEDTCSVCVQLHTDEDAPSAQWRGPIRKQYVLDAMVAIDRTVAIVDGQVLLVREV